MKKKPKKRAVKSDFKTKKRVMRVLKALLNMEEHTAYIAAAMYPLLEVLSKPVQSAKDQPFFKPTSNKKKMNEFRENWLDKQKVIQLMPVSERSLYALRKEGKLPSYTFKGKIFFKLQDVENLMQSRK